MTTQPKADHPCDACGGSGWRTFCDEHGCTERCPICLGSGRISDRMPVSDAVADAETLYLFASMLDGRHHLRKVFALWRTCWTALGYDADQNARAFTYRARLAFDAVPTLRGNDAAFRAVPGLREE